MPQGKSSCALSQMMACLRAREVIQVYLESSTVQCLIGIAMVLPTPDTGIRIITTLFCGSISERIRMA